MKRKCNNARLLYPKRYSEVNTKYCTSPCVFLVKQGLKRFDFSQQRNSHALMYWYTLSRWCVTSIQQQQSSILQGLHSLSPATGPRWVWCELHDVSQCQLLTSRFTGKWTHSSSECDGKWENRTVTLASSNSGFLPICVKIQIIRLCPQMYYEISFTSSESILNKDDIIIMQSGISINTLWFQTVIHPAYMGALSRSSSTHAASWKMFY